MKFLAANLNPKSLSTTLPKVSALNKGENGCKFDVIFLIGDTLPESNSYGEEVIKSLQSLEQSGSKIFISKGTENTADFSNSSAELPVSTLTSGDSNIILCGDYGIAKLHNGALLGFLGANPSQHKQEVLKLFASYKLDILVTYEWPETLCQERGDAAALHGIGGDAFLDQIIQLTQPRYCLAAGSPTGHYFARGAFGWPDSAAERVTRFVSIAQFGGKEKWAVAFNLSVPFTRDDPGKGLTENPFLHRPAEDRKRLREEGNDRNGRYSRDSRDSRNDRNDRNNRRGNKKTARAPVAPQQCFFCLSNPNVERHLLLSIGDHSYMALQKGPLTSVVSVASQERMSGDFLITPISHIARFTELEREPGAEVADLPVYQEMCRFEDAVAKMFRERYGCAVLFWQASRRRGVHLITQGYAVPESEAGRLVEALQAVEAQQEKPALKFAKVGGEKRREKGQEGQEGQEEMGDGDGGNLGEQKNESLKKEDRQERSSNENEERSDGKDQNNQNEKISDSNSADGSLVSQNINNPLAVISPAEAAAIANSDDHVRVRIASSAADDTFYSRIDGMFDFQFVRKVIARALQLPKEQIDWKNCVQSVEDETRDAEAFRTQFSAYDFTR